MNMQNAQNSNNPEQRHDVTIRSRESMSISGVMEVMSFDESGVMLETVMGIMGVEGEELRITRLDTDRKEVDLEGRFNGIAYAEKRVKRRLFSKG